jgi:hypothetical protein
MLLLLSVVEELVSLLLGIEEFFAESFFSLLLLIDLFG